MRVSTYPPPSTEGADPMGKPRLSHWIRRVRPDDDLVVSALYREYHRPLLAFVARLTGGDRQWAEDVVQETMIRAWRSAERLDPASVSLMPWLATVARRIVIDDRRRRDARPRESSDGPLERVPMPDEVDGMLHQVVVSDALRALSPAHREILNETILRDRSVNDAAQALGIPVGTVKSRVYYAVRALRVALEERGVTA
ncbi:sigma-70 family RNA polymerase sigma factor [Nonomuraea lactucae]|uniref:sigma-70 family RNA polymerase sigma factor n=1 Tax=Nonomuraea lactucae TaxID=2249762 RepID=UPI000DE4319C|nr:sigma-70 family RNA polymerase sigma factor [Nonomuraea lactucae]